MSYKIIFFIFLGFVFQNLRAQDPGFSQIFANRLYLNPAYAGANNGMRLAVNHRQLWPGVPGPFYTFGLGLDVRAPGVSGGIGLTLMNDVRGEGFLKTNKIGFVYSYRNLIGKYDRSSTEFSFGVEPAVVNKNIDWSKFEFSDQFDPVFGKIFQSAATPPPSASITYMDIAAGFTFNHRIKTNAADYYFGWGGAMQHLTRPTETFVGTTRTVPIKYSFTGGGMLPVSDGRSPTPTFLFPHFRYERQGSFQAVNAGMYFYKYPAFVGINYDNSPKFQQGKNTNSLIVTLGLVGGWGEANSYQISYSYDLNATGLGGGTYGSHELALVFSFDSFKLANLGKGGEAKRKLLNCMDFPHKGVFRMF